MNFEGIIGKHFKKNEMAIQIKSGKKIFYFFYKKNDRIVSLPLMNIKVKRFPVSLYSLKRPLQIT
jgi:hypothetical protein